MIDFHWFWLIFRHFRWFSVFLEFQMGGKGRFWLILGGLGGVLGALGAVRRSEICFQDRFLRKENGRGRQKRSQDAPRGVKKRPKGPPKLPKWAPKGPKLGAKSVEKNAEKKHTKNLKIGDPLEWKPWFWRHGRSKIDTKWNKKSMQNLCKQHRNWKRRSGRHWRPILVDFEVKRGRKLRQPDAPGGMRRGRGG